MGFKREQDTAGAMPFIRVIVPCRFARFHGEGHQNVAQPLARTFIKTEQGMARIVWLRILIEDILHMPDRLPGNLSYTPPLGEPGFELVFFNAFRTLARQMDSTTWSSTRRSAILWSVQRAAPAGASAHASIVTCETTRVSTLSGCPGRGCSCKRVTISWPGLC